MTKKKEEIKQNDLILEFEQVFTFDGEMNPENVYEFINSVETNFRPETQRIKVYLTSAGGSIAHSSVLIDYFNNFTVPVVLISFWELSSAAFDVFFKSVKCERIVLEDSFSMLHKMSFTANLLHSNNEYSFEKVLTNFYKNRQMKSLEWFKSLGITDKEIKQIKNGKEIIINSIRINEMLSNQMKTLNQNNVKFYIPNK